MSVKRTVENVYLRQDAVQMTRRHFWPLLGMTLIITLITNGLDSILTAIGDQLMVPEVTALTNQYNNLLNSSQITSSEPLFQAVSDLFTSPKFLLFNLVFIVLTGLVSAGLTLGRIQVTIDAAQGGVPAAAGVFKLMKYCLKAWGLEVWVLIKTLLWTLPGIGTMIFGGELLGYGAAEIGNAVMVIGAVLIFGLCIPALHRYSLAFCVLADDPTRGIRESVNCSTGLMKDRKWQYFKLNVPVILKIIAVSWAAELIFSVVEYTIAVDYTVMYYIRSILTWAATVYFYLQMHMLHALFYLHRRDHRELRDDGAPKPVSYWLREHTDTEIKNESAPEEPSSPVALADIEHPEECLPETNDNTKENAP